MQPLIPVGVRLSLPTEKMTPESLVVTCRTALELGFSSIWTPDHLLVPERTTSPYPYSADGTPTFGANRSFLDPLHTLGWLSGQLPTAGLGTGILIAPLRRPAVLAKQISYVVVRSTAPRHRHRDGMDA